MDSGRPAFAIVAALILILLLPGVGTSTPGIFPAEPRPSAIPIPLHAVRVQITNSQATATGTYQQMIVLNSSAYATWLNANDSNVVWRYLNGTAIPAWMALNASSSAARTTWWLLLYSIGAGATVTVYLDMYGTGQMLLSKYGPTGEAPQLTTTYAAFDNGWRVFGFYDNFSGTSLKAGWSVNSPGYTVSNGMSMEAGGWQIAFQSTYLVSFNTTIDSMFNSTGPGPYFNTGLGSNATNQYVDHEFRYQDSGKNYAFEGNSGISGATAVNNAAIPNVWLVMSGVVGPNLQITVNYTSQVVHGNSPSPYTSYATNDHHLHFGACCNNAQTVLLRWIDVRSNPPGNTMPSVTFLPAIPLPGAPIVTRTNSTAIGISWTNPANGAVDNTVLVGNASGGNCLGPYLSIDTGSAVTSWNVTGLLPAHSYCLSVRDWFAGYVSSAFTSPPLIANTTSGTIVLASPTAPGVAFSTLLLVALAIGALVGLSLILWLGFPDRRSKHKGGQRPVDARSR